MVYVLTMSVITATRNTVAKHKKTSPMAGFFMRHRPKLKLLMKHIHFMAHKFRSVALFHADFSGYAL